ncbi:plasmid segregation protein ParM domain-containing protein [Escherichia coli]
MEIGMKIFCDDGSANVKLAWFEGKTLKSPLPACNR